MRVQPQRIFRMPRLTQNQTTGSPGDLLPTNPMMDLRV
jgi:hypothetical protein